jgi:hypothetical protein
MHEELVIPIIALFLPMVLVPSVITLKHRQKKREWLHQERMRAIELGLPVPPSEHGLGMAVTAVGAGVPMAAVFAAFLTSTSASATGEDPVSMLGVIWGSTAIICSFAVISSTILGITALRSGRPVEEPASQKPAFDPDAYDVVGRRG